MNSGSHTRPDGDSINLQDNGQVELWIRSLGVSREELQAAVDAVGSSTGDVYDYIGRNRTNRT